MTGSSSGKTRDESVQFSLKELLKLEDERQEEQSRERQAHEARMAKQREEDERRRREEAAARERAELEAFERHQREELDQVARREAMQKALVEQSRLEVEIRARAEEREAERRHELELQRLRLEGKKGQLSSLIPSTLLGAGIMLATALGLHFGTIKPSHDRHVAELEQSIATAESRTTDLNHQADDQKRTIEGLERKVAEQQTEIATLKNNLASTSTKKPSGSPAGTSGTRRTTTTTTSTTQAQEKPCLKGDPLCPTIGGN